MAFQIDQEALLKAETQCLEKIERYTPEQGYCNMTWDLMLCWEEAPAGTLVRKACPSHVKDISKTGFALRECGLDGIWVHPDDENATTGLGLDKDVIQLSEDKFIFNEDGGAHWECKLLVTLFMYALSASMMWIFMEGLYLHMLVYKTLFTERTGIRICWNVDEYGFNWIIMGPITFTIVLNFIFFINIVRVLCIRMKTHRNITNKSSNQQISSILFFERRGSQ
ncbi:CALCR-like protein [Mya arenaria]|uniref:CALCR-like protein n=1 Tax=Mya arenaria TaxID=6604 RepID=A0ABY7DEG4_MYAAR|nr:CALCR-like protein [Mya arenaria]